MRMLLLSGFALFAVGCDQLSGSSTTPTPPRPTEPAAPAPPPPSPVEAVAPTTETAPSADPANSAELAAPGAGQWSVGRGASLIEDADGVQVTFTGEGQFFLFVDETRPVRSGDTLRAAGVITADRDGAVGIQVFRSCGSTNAEGIGETLNLMADVGVPFQLQYTFELDHACARFRVGSTDSSEMGLTITDFSFGS